MATAIEDIVANVRATAWQRTDNFDVSIESKQQYLDVENIIKGEKKSIIWHKSIVSMSLPGISTPANEKFLGGEWVIGTQKPEVFRWSIRFRDFNGGDLRRWFMTQQVFMQYNYVEDSYITFKVQTRDSETTIFESEKVLIESVSEASFENGANAISEFSVEFKSPTYSDELLKDFGSKEYIDKFTAVGNSGSVVINSDVVSYAKDRF